MKPWTNPIWLKDKLINKRMSCAEIAELLNKEGYKVTKMTIYNWAIKLGIKTQTMSYGPRSVSRNATRGDYYSQR